MEPWQVDQRTIPQELRERAARMVAQVRLKYPSDWPTICAVAEKLGSGPRGNGCNERYHGTDP